MLSINSFVIFGILAFFSEARAFLGAGHSPRSRTKIISDRNHREFAKIPQVPQVQRSTNSLLANVRSTTTPRSAQSSLPYVILRKILFPVRFTLRAIFRLATRFTSAFMVAVITDPALNRAIADTVKEGMNRFLTQKTVKQKLGKFQETLSESQPSLAKEAGEDFIKVFISFLEGLLTPDLTPYRDPKDGDDGEPLVLDALNNDSRE